MNSDKLRRYLWGLAGAAMLPIRYMGRSNPYAEFRSIPGAEAVRAPSASSGKRILIVPIRVSSTSNLLEGVIGAALKLDGHRVFALLDGGSLRFSENATLGKSWFVANALSVHEQRQLCSTFGLEPRYFGDLIDPAEMSVAIKPYLRATYNDLVASTYEGIPIGKHARHGLMRFLRQETVDVPENAHLLRQFVETALRTALAVRTVVRREGITHALISHGIYSTWGTALDVLVSEGVKVSVWGRGYVGGNPIFGRNQSYMSEGIAESVEDVQQSLAHVEPNRSFLQTYFAAKATPGSGIDVVSYYDQSKHSAGVPQPDLRQGYARLVSVFPNIPWDGTMFAASPYTPSLRSFARKVVLAAQTKPNIRFVVRCHPAEKHRDGNNSRESFSSFFSREDRATTNLTIIEPDDDLTSYDLMPATDAALVFATTMSMELLHRGIPVIQTGRDHLVNRELVFEVTSDFELIKRLNEVEFGDLKCNFRMRENFEKYAYYYLKVLHVYDDMIAATKFRFDRYRFSNVNSLRGNSLASCDTIKKYVLGATDKCLNPYFSP